MKKFIKGIFLIAFIALVIVAICNTYSWIVTGKQYIKINTSSKAYTDHDLYVSIIAQDKGVDLETKTNLKLLDSNGKAVKNVNIKYEDNNAILSIPKIETGNYVLEAKVSSKVGKDTIKKDIYIADGKQENVTITLDKGIYKPGDTINFRALLTNKENDTPISNDLNISIYDGNDNRVYNENTKSSDYGIVSGNFTLANEVNSGLYKLVIKTNNGETTKQFKVNPYVTPKYEVKVKYDSDNYLVEDTATITFNAKYFFGEPVENADLTIYVNNQEYKTLKTNPKGIATMDYYIEEVGTYNIKVEAVDKSNYYVEATSSFTAGTDFFEIELLPEYGDLIENKKNNIYVFTKKADGTPVKAYVTVSLEDFTKQIATDENGIGKFSIDIKPQSVNNFYSVLYRDSEYREESFSVIAEDKSGNQVLKDIELKVENKNILISTDKVKYQQGEDIKVNISSLKDNAKNIYFLKNNNLLKMITTDLDNTTINLGENYGLIDIYVTEKATTRYNNYYKNIDNNTFKKTIFIMPTKKLGIDINTDKKEYKPGENISISFNSKDENKLSVDAALLVSMLDNSILNLANNDLSIDNIKLALQDIKFSNDLDAATLYSCLVNDSSEQAIMALLLKQNNKDITVSETGMYNTEQEEKASIIAISSIAIILAIVIISLCIKFKKFRSIIKHIVNFVIYDLVLIATAACIINKFFWSVDFSWRIVIVITTLGLATYILFINKLNKKVFRTSISIIISFVLTILFYYLFIELEIYAFPVVLVISIVILVLAILAKISEKKKWKIEKYMKHISNEIEYIIKFIWALIVSLIIALFIQAIIQIEGIMIPIAVLIIYLFNDIFNRKLKKSLNKKTKANYVVLILASIAAIVIGSVIIERIDDFLDQSNGAILNRSSDVPEYNDVIPRSRALDPTFFTATDNAAIEKGSNSLFESIKDMLPSSDKENGMIVQNKNETISNEENKKVVDENVRNVFLESMCFIPELITNNGSANANLKLSDNITNWTIQTVGNTKDGRVGYGMLNNVKVFKDFFVDFELPKNIIEKDKISIPVTVYNYTSKPINTEVKIKQEDWFKANKNNIKVKVEAKSTNMVYVPISVIKSGTNKFRAEVLSNNQADIVEKECTISPKGYKVEKVVSTGSLDEDISEDILILEDTIKDTAKAKVKIYSSTMSQTIEGMENIFRMPTGCFEQISSSLYPNILALKYLQDNGIVNEEIKSKALSYISSGYQKILTYEVKGESGGYSLYGDSPAETVLTAYGLMELSDLSKVYDVDSSVLEKMTNFLYKKQNFDGTFSITGSHLGGANSSDKIALNAYITWALSESNPNDGRINKSIEYLKGKLKDIDDNYTLALVANVLANVKDRDLESVLKRLVNNINLDGNCGYITSNIIDYYGTRANGQTIQTVALTSMALSKASYSAETNKLLINYLIGKKDTYGTWYSTQATILVLKAINEKNDKNKLENQTITVKVNSDEQKIEIKDNPLELYELTFENLGKENKLSIDIEKENAYYEVIEEYYLPYEKVNTKNDNIEVLVESNNNLKVNDMLNSNIRVINRSGNTISNGMVTISIPQGFTVNEESLMLLESKGIIEKYETSYRTVNVYLREFEVGEVINLGVGFRASYPVEITGMSVRAYDYYNPEVEGKSMPIKINVKAL